MDAPLGLRREARRELGFALLAVVSILIGFARITEHGVAPLWMRALDASIALLFALDWLIRVFRAEAPGRYALRHGYEALTFIPFTLLPLAEAGGGDFLRSLRLIRVVQFARLGAFAKLGLGLARLPRRLNYVGRVLDHAQIISILVTALVTVSLGAAGLLAAERATNAAVRTYGDAWWWAFSILTNVAYDVPVPTTPWGRGIVGVLMLGGIAFIGLFTAGLASALLKTPTEPPEELEGRP